MDIFEKNIIDLYRREAESGEEKSLAGYRYDPLFPLIPSEVRKLSQGLWHPLKHESFYTDGKKLSILDAGCGGGFDMYYLNMKYPGFRYIGVDLSPDLLAKGRLALARHGFHPEFVNSNLKQLPFKDGHLDAAFSHAVIHLSTERDRVIKELYRVLKSPGMLMVCDPIMAGRIPRFFPEEYKKSGGIFLYGGLTGLEDYQRWSAAAGFSHFDLIETVPFKPQATIAGMLQKRYGKPMVSREELDQVEFSLATFTLVKGDKWGKRRIKCASCGSLSVVNYCAVINIEFDPELEQMVFHRRLNFGQCRSCGAPTDCPLPFFYIRPDGVVLNKRPERFRYIAGKERGDYSAALPGVTMKLVYGQEEFFKLAARS
ncbi:MAG: methyltransferase domain-containing protein [bacterium]|nr:methyltransferase domain-containing protein [bacterium]